MISADSEVVLSGKKLAVDELKMVESKTTRLVVRDCQSDNWKEVGPCLFGSNLLFQDLRELVFDSCDCTNELLIECSSR